MRRVYTFEDNGLSTVVKEVFLYGLCFTEAGGRLMCESQAETVTGFQIHKREDLEREAAGEGVATPFYELEIAPGGSPAGYEGVEIPPGEYVLHTYTVLSKLDAMLNDGIVTEGELDEATARALDGLPYKEVDKQIDMLVEDEPDDGLTELQPGFQGAFAEADAPEFREQVATEPFNGPVGRVEQPGTTPADMPM